MSGSGETIWGVIPAAGIGTRMSAEQPKQYLPLAGLTVLEHSLNALLACPSIESVFIALHPDDDRPGSMDCFANSRVRQAIGGATRSQSVLAALLALREVGDKEDWVLVHDAARPCVKTQEIQSLISTVCNSGVGGILAEPLVDTVKYATDSGEVLETLDRSKLWRAQTPQMFRLGLLITALEEAQAANHAVTDEASAMERVGHPVQLVKGSSRNLKITVVEDLQLAEFYLQQSDSRS